MTQRRLGDRLSPPGERPLRAFRPLRAELLLHLTWSRSWRTVSWVHAGTERERSGIVYFRHDHKKAQTDLDLVQSNKHRYCMHGFFCFWTVLLQSISWSKLFQSIVVLGEKKSICRQQFLLNVLCNTASCFWHDLSLYLPCQKSVFFFYSFF